MASLLGTIAQSLLGVSKPKKQPKKKIHRPAKLKTETAYVSSEDGPTAVFYCAPKPMVSEQKREQVAESSPSRAWVENSTIDRSTARERIVRDVEREDYLLNQIDEFREKAQQLQQLLLTKESKVAELQNIVDEREGKAKELEHILKDRQKKADGITLEMTQQIDSLIGKVSAKMDELGTTIEESVGKELSETRELSKKQLEGLNELKELLETINPQLETIKGEMSEKVHTENVKCYRNIADLFKSMEDKVDSIDEVEKNVSSLRKTSVIILAVSIINMLGLIALALYELGIFQKLLG